MLYDPIRSILGILLVPALKITGFRFSKDYRYGITRWNRLVYFFVDTVGANLKAGL